MADALKSIAARPVGGVNPFAAQSQELEQGEARKARRQSGERHAFALPEETAKAGTGGGSAAGISDDLTLSPEAQQQLRQLRMRDAEVRAHERAHMAAGGAHVVGGASYVYQKGPDGRQYAIGGHVDIDTSPVAGDAEASAEKARQIKRAALAPGQPSAQDRKVAAQAAAQEADANADKRVEEKREQEEQGAAQGSAHAVNGMAHGLAGYAAAALHETERASLVHGMQAARDTALRGMSGQETMAAMQAVQGHDVQAVRLRAAEAYASMVMRGSMPTALAPAGTGISLQI